MPDERVKYVVGVTLIVGLALNAADATWTMSGLVWTTLRYAVGLTFLLGIAVLLVFWLRDKIKH